MKVIHVLPVASTALLVWCLIAVPSPLALAEGGPIFTTATECFTTADPRGGISTQTAANKGTISPSCGPPGEDLHVRVTVRNVLGAPLSGASITVTAIPGVGATFLWDNGQVPPGDTSENPQVSLSDAAGVVELVFDEGGVSLPAIPMMPDVNFTVLIDEPGPRQPYYGYSCTTHFSVLSYDLNADGRVNLTDFAIFSLDFGAVNPRSDFDWSGSTNLTDFAAFSSHFGASLDAQ